MDSINRIKDLMNKVETKNFIIKEQELGNLLGLGTDAVRGLWDMASSAINDAVPYVVDKATGHKLLNEFPFSGNIEKVCGDAAKMFISTVKSSVNSKTDVYNSLIVLNNLLKGAESGKILDSDGLTLEPWEVFEVFTGAIYYESRGKNFTYADLWDTYIETDDIDDVSDGVIEWLDSNINYGSTIGDDGTTIKEFMLEFFESGQSFTAFWNTDRLDGDWKFGEIFVNMNLIDISEYQDTDRLMSEFEVRLSGDLPCYESAKFKPVTVNSEKVNAFVRKENKWLTVLFYKNDTLTANVYYGDDRSTPVATTTDIDCGGNVTSGQNMDDLGGVNDINESFIIEQQSSPKKYVKYGGVRFAFDSETFEEMKALHNGGTSDSSADDDTENNTTTDTTTVQPNDTTTDTTTVQPDNTNQNDSGEDQEVTPAENMSNIDRLVALLISKGVQEVVARDPKNRASMGSIAVGALTNDTVTPEDYTKNEENLYAEKFIESIEKGITTFKRNETNHDIQAREEERVINTTTKISNPTPLELQKIEEIGDDAVSKTNNELSFDKNRIQSIRVTSNETQVVYIAKEDITDMISNIEGQLERVFGGDWKLDKAKNKFMSSNKLFIFTKKEE